MQSNATSRIQAGLGALLFHRHSRGVALTKGRLPPTSYGTNAGRLLAEAKRAVLDDEAPAGRLELGSLETTNSLQLSPLITRYSMAHPEVDLSLRVTQQILGHTLDGAFVCGPVEHANTMSEIAFREELVIARVTNAKGQGVTSGCKILVMAPDSSTATGWNAFPAVAAEALRL